ncbi:hypothetical protein BJX62DRAFT_219871, partial [Aspergillus germanicus]
MPRSSFLDPTESEPIICSMTIPLLPVLSFLDIIIASAFHCVRLPSFISVFHFHFQPLFTCQELPLFADWMLCQTHLCSIDLRHARLRHREDWCSICVSFFVVSMMTILCLRKYIHLHIGLLIKLILPRRED